MIVAYAVTGHVRQDLNVSAPRQPPGYVVLAYVGWGETENARKAHEAALLDPALLKAVGLTLVQLMIVMATALFFSTAVLPTGPLLLQMETGALMTAAGVAVAFAAARLLGVGRYHAPSSHGGKS